MQVINIMLNSSPFVVYGHLHQNHIVKPMQWYSYHLLLVLLEWKAQPIGAVVVWGHQNVCVYCVSVNLWTGKDVFVQNAARNGNNEGK